MLSLAAFSAFDAAVILVSAAASSCGQFGGFPCAKDATLAPQMSSVRAAPARHKPKERPAGTHRAARLPPSPSLLSRETARGGQSTHHVRGCVGGADQRAGEEHGAKHPVVPWGEASKQAEQPSEREFDGEEDARGRRGSAGGQSLSGSSIRIPIFVNATLAFELWTKTTVCALSSA